MKVHSPSIPSPLGKMTPPSPANAEQLRAMRAAAWHKQGIVVVPLDDIFDAWDRAFLLGIATKLYGARTAASRKSIPWAEGDVIDRGDGETWRVVATTVKSITVQRDRDGALATLGQLGEERP